MIHNLRVHSDNPTDLAISFQVITEVGSCLCIVRLNDKDKDGRAKCFVDSYQVLGVLYNEKSKNPERTSDNPLMVEGIKRIANVVGDICDCNQWNRWSY